MKPQHSQHQLFIRQSGEAIRSLLMGLSTIILISILVLFLSNRYGKQLRESGDNWKESADNLVDLRNTSSKVVEVAGKVGGLAERFNSSNIRNTFRSRLRKVRSTQGNMLEVAVLEADETFVREDNRKVLWDKLDLGTTTTEIMVPATFRYQIDILEEWTLESKDSAVGKVLTVRAPRIRPVTPVAFDTAQMRIHSDEGWGRFNGQEATESLIKSITPRLDEKATDYLGDAREASRQAVQEFVVQWLVKEEHWGDDKFQDVLVTFSDEDANGNTLSSARLLE